MNSRTCLGEETRQWDLYAKGKGTRIMTVSNCNEQLLHKVAVYTFFKIHLKKGLLESQSFC